MSVRRWNAVAERKRYERYLQVASILLQKEAEMSSSSSSEETSSSSDSSSDEEFASVPTILITAAIDLKSSLNCPIVEDS